MRRSLFGGGSVSALLGYRSPPTTVRGVGGGPAQHPGVAGDVMAWGAKTRRGPGRPMAAAAPVLPVLVHPCRRGVLWHAVELTGDGVQRVMDSVDKGHRARDQCVWWVVGVFLSANLWNRCSR
jgi:hypothetical protein